MAFAYDAFFPSPAPKGESPFELPPTTNHRPVDPVEGGQVDYFSASHGWLPAKILEVDAETGALKVDLDPDQTLALTDQRFRLRPPTKPGRGQLEHLRLLLREGRVGGEVQKLFDSYSCFVGAEAVLPNKALPHVACDVDRKLGICGALCQLREAQKKSGGLPFTLDHFTEVFWELLWRVQREHGDALDGDAVKRRPNLQRRNPKELYQLQSKLGEGSYGSVYLTRCPETGVRRAVKAIEKWQGTQHDTDPEITVLLALDHPNVVKLYEHYEDASNHYIVMDFCSGGDLANTVQRRKSSGAGHFEDFYVQDVMQQVLKAIAHVHARGILHLDLKSANIMLMPSKSTLPPSRNQAGTLAKALTRPHVMVIDLGVSQLFRPGNFGDSAPCGTPATMAPEVWMGELTPKADIFSLGVILFELLSLCFPFQCGADHRAALAYWRQKPEAPWMLVQHRSDYALGLCRRMMLFDRHRRPPAAKCLQARYFATDEGDLQTRLLQLGEVIPSRIPEDYVERLARVPQRTLLHNSVALAIAQVWPSNQLPTIKRMFQELDVDHKGRLDLKNVRSALERWGLEAERAFVVADAMDLNRDGSVGWTEFVAACIHLGDDALEDDLRRIFLEADSDGDGMLGQSDLAPLLAADHLRGQNVQDVFADLAGRAEDTARVDWPTFRRHFRTKSREAEPVEPLQVMNWDLAEPPPVGGVSYDQPAPRSVSRFETPQWPQPAEVNQFYAEASGLFDRARGALFPDAQKSEAQYEDNLRALSDMGMSDRDKNLAALRKCGNAISEALLDEVLKS